jgi:probable F420-dependent oxidoreductase
MADAVRSGDELIALAKWAEAAGFSTLLLRDHVVEHPFGHQLGPLVAMAVAASHTSTLRIGTLVISNDFRPPVQLAKEIATLDQVSGGRIELGLGAGFLSAEYEALGIPFDPPGVRVSRLQESVRLLKHLFAGGSVSFHGEHYTVDQFDNFPVPPQGDRLPILVAGAGDRMLRLAAREADIVGLQTVTTTSGTVVADPANWMASAVRRRVDLIREAAGERFEALELSTTVTVELYDDRVTGARKIIVDRGWDGVAVDDVLQMPAYLIGSPSEMAGQLLQRREEYDLSYFVVSQAESKLLAPIVQSLASTRT